MSRSFNSDHVRRFVGPDLGSKCSKSLSAEGKELSDHAYCCQNGNPISRL